ncbi:MAG TPA: hypothetical protein VEK56_02405, partial [Vicinamibacterales bacterium]|nr:hypothetical protein [Vicinamibacterales bacterium]
DLNEALSRVYGGSLLLATPTTRPIGAASERRTIGRWQDADTQLVLWREEFPNRVGLTITSIAGDAALQQVIADGVRLQTADAPARDLARRTAEAAAIQARDEKIRIDNKTKFKPN